MIIYRVVSAIVTICVVIPLWILICAIWFVYSLVNNLLYTNIMTDLMPDEYIEKIAGQVQNEMVIRVGWALGKAIAELYSALKEIKHTKF